MPEAVVARLQELPFGEMRQVQVNGTDVLLARLSDGSLCALSAHCTHYGAPLVDGVLSDDRVVCPWHHACFDLRTGDLLEPPGLDGLVRYDVRIKGEDVVVQLPDEPTDRRAPEAVRRDEADDRLFVVLGDGAAGLYAAETLRAAGYRGRLLMISREPYAPYDRPNCSKDYLAGKAPEEWMVFRPDDFYAERDIELLRNRSVTEVDAASRTLTFEDGSRLPYDGLVLCTGARPRTLRVPGADLANVHTLRSYDDSKVLLEKGRRGGKVVVVGASFIGMEAAFSLRTLGCEVTVVAPESVPFEAVLGDRVGHMLQTIHEENGVSFRLGRTVKAFEGSDHVEHVLLSDGERLETDLVIVGIGVVPETDIVKGVERAEDGSIIVDEYLHAGNNLYAAGDIARFPDWRTGEPIRIEHWRVANQHGRIAALNLVGKEQPYRSVPFFWTAHFGVNVRYVGHVSAWDEVVYDGDPADRRFIAYYVKDGKVQAAAGAGRDRDMAALEELLRLDRCPSPEELSDGNVDLRKRLHEAV